MKGRGSRFRARDEHTVITDLTFSRLKTMLGELRSKSNVKNVWRRETNINL